MSRGTSEMTSVSASFYGIRNDYEAARSSRYRRRRTGIAPSGSSADYHYRSESDYLRLMEMARDMDRNDIIVGQMISRAIDNRVQGGFTIDWRSGEKELDRDLQQRWDEEADDADLWDIEGEKCFADFEWLSARQTDVDGDVLILPTVEGSLQMVEGHRLRTPRNTTRNVVHGVLLDDADRPRRRLEYWLTKDDIDPNRSLHRVSDIRAVSARDEAGNRQVLQQYDSKRATQTRGVTVFAPMFDALGMFEDIQFARLVQQQVVSCFAIFRKRAADYQNQGRGRRARGTQEVTTHEPGGQRKLIESIHPGMEIPGEPGETLEGFAPRTPNPEFFDHVRLILTLIGINVGMPLVMVLLDASETNFSGWRGAVDQARLSFRRRQRQQIRQYHNPVTDFKLRVWANGDRPLRNRLEKLTKKRIYQWQPPSWPYVEPYKDAVADAAKIANHLTSPRRLHAERNGRSWDDVSTEIIEDNSLAIRKAVEAAAKINKDLGPEDRVSWRDMLNLPTPGNTKTSLTGMLDGNDSKGDSQADQP